MTIFVSKQILPLHKKNICQVRILARKSTVFGLEKFLPDSKIVLTFIKSLFHTVNGEVNNLEIKIFFTLCEGQTSMKRSELRRVSFTLRRNRVETMEELCDMMENSPKQLSFLRDVGVKSVELIKEVCFIYKRNLNMLP